MNIASGAPASISLNIHHNKDCDVEDTVVFVSRRGLNIHHNKDCDRRERSIMANRGGLNIHHNKDCDS